MVSAMKIAGGLMDCCKKNDKKMMEEENESESKVKTDWIMPALSIVLLGLLVFNQFAINDLNIKIAGLGFGTASATGNSAVTSQATGQSQIAVQPQQQQQAALAAQQIWAGIAPTGVPEVYGSELSISYDNVEAAMPVMYQFDDYLGSKPIQLSGEKQQRYIAITTAISCEYCCGADTITTATGQAACGCAHSAAMRGLAKYLLDKHPEMTDDQILGELGKWKVLYFPDNSVKKAAALQANNLPTDYISLSSNKYRGIESQTSASPQGGLPSQVGGC